MKYVWIWSLKDVLINEKQKMVQLINEYKRPNQSDKKKSLFLSWLFIWQKNHFFSQFILCDCFLVFSVFYDIKLDMCNILDLMLLLKWQ